MTPVVSVVFIIPIVAVAVLTVGAIGASLLDHTTLEEAIAIPWCSFTSNGRRARQEDREEKSSSEES
jgi:hypothetical protein